MCAKIEVCVSSDTEEKRTLPYSFRVRAIPVELLIAARRRHVLFRRSIFHFRSELSDGSESAKVLLSIGVV